MKARYWRAMAIVGVALAMPFTAMSWGKPQPVPLPGLPETIPQPAPGSEVAPPVTLPIPSQPNVRPVADWTPTPPMSVTAQVPVVPSPSPHELNLPAGPLPIAQQSPAPPQPAEPGILEPVATIHRFTGKYLGYDNNRVLVYVEKDGKAEVQSLSFAAAEAKIEKRIEVPTGKVAYHDGRVFVTTPRELLVVTSTCEIDWRFTLPGKPDNSEKLLEVAGFHGNHVCVLSQQEPKIITKEQQPIGRIYTLQAATGTQSEFAMVAGGFDLDAKFAVGSEGNIFVFSKTHIRAYSSSTGRNTWEDTKPLAHPLNHIATRDGDVIATTPEGIVRFTYIRPETLMSEQGTAPVAFQDRLWVYAPIKSEQGTFLLNGRSEHGHNKWSVRVPQEITVAPVIHTTSVYFLSGKVLYRVNAATGEVCWKHTLELKAGEVLTELAFVGNELRASGSGVLVRITDRPEEPAKKPNEPKPGEPKIPPLPDNE